MSITITFELIPRKNLDMVFTKLLKADYHGAILKSNILYLGLTQTSSQIKM